MSEVQYYAETKLYKSPKDLPSQLCCKCDWPVGARVFIRQKETGNILALGTVQDSFEGTATVKIVKRFT